MKPIRDSRRRGSAFLEFALVTAPLIFIVVSLVWMCIGMWEYHTLAEAVNETTRYAAVHGADCVGQTCATTLNQIATTLAGRAPGIPAHQISVTLTSTAQSYPSALLDSYYGNSTAWPSLAGNVTATTDISITATYQLSAPISMWVPGIGSYQFAAITLGATSKQPIIY
ncbi:MAG TPA: TadE family protein [Bryobacteraceae bacterium]|jgi:Flp pilus assembly protein TadG